MKPDCFAHLTPIRVFAVLIVVGLLSYWNAIAHPFVHDDVVFIANNPAIKQIDLNEIFKPKTIDQAPSDLVNIYYRPLIELFHCLQYKIFGLNAYGFHLTNIALHIINAFLLYLFGLKIIGAGSVLPISLALIFMVHPVQTEAVACVSGVSNLLLLVFFLSSLLLYIRSKEVASKEIFYGALAIFFFGCFVKEQMIVLPVIIILMELLLFPKEQRSYKGIGGYFIVLAFYFVIRKVFLGTTVTVIFDEQGEYMLRFMAIPRSLMTYFSLVVFPINLHYYRSLDVLQSNTSAWIMVCLLIVIVIIAIIKTQSSQRKYLYFGLGWFIVTMAPMLNIVPLVNEYSTILNFEHFLYIPLIGLLLFAFVLIKQWTVARLNSKSWTGLVIFFVVLVILMGLTLKQNTYWKSEVVLFNRTLKYQESGRVRILLGKAYYFQKDYEKAIDQYEKALMIIQGYTNKIHNSQLQQFYNGFIKGIYFDLAHCYEALQNDPETVKMYNLALGIDPDDVALYNNLAVFYIKKNEIDRAIDYLEKALTLDSQDQLTMQNLAYCYVQKGWKSKADNLFNRK